MTQLIGFMYAVAHAGSTEILIDPSAPSAALWLFVFISIRVYLEKKQELLCGLRSFNRLGNIESSSARSCFEIWEER